MNGSSGGAPEGKQTPAGHSYQPPTATDGGTDCFYCGNQTDYHPTCDRLGCENQTHGSRPEGKLVKSYCYQCRSGDSTIVTDGGRLLCVRCNETYDRDEHDQCPNCRNFDLATFGGVKE